MKHYIAQCKHQVGENDQICPVCQKKIERIWDINVLGIDNATRLADKWKTNRSPEEIYNKAILPYDRKEYVYKMCSKWDSENPDADEDTRNNAFREIIKDMFRKEYERSCQDKDYYSHVRFSNNFVRI